MWENILKILQRYGYVYLEGLAGTLWIAAYEEYTDYARSLGIQ